VLGGEDCQPSHHEAQYRFAYLSAQINIARNYRKRNPPRVRPTRRAEANVLHSCSQSRLPNGYDLAFGFQ
jgi:hypothetical protein